MKKNNISAITRSFIAAIAIASMMISAGTAVPVYADTAVVKPAAESVKEVEPVEIDLIPARSGADRGRMEAFWDEVFTAALNGRGEIRMDLGDMHPQELVNYLYRNYNVGREIEIDAFEWRATSVNGVITDMYMQTRRSDKIREAAVEKQAVDEWIRNETAGRTADLAGVKAIYAELADRMVYDYGYNYWGPYGLVTNNAGVCADFAMLFSMMLREMGIECYYVSGYAGGGRHAWNTFTLKDQNGEDHFYTVDVCWAACCKGTPKEWYYFQEDPYRTMRLGEERIVEKIY